ncbi:hypothetical protein [Burkholderia sp. FL-7-2-10-S1-D7]|uniref:hypothetical protein n=1 Tax=Burkholderia sp. FL-7-2-10-S1-D7 TaxID=1637866 RepID=UPI000A6B807F|nr:hypothetical protein [Burkholderia sp. FL-7-2-10-S1-D7]
MFAYDSSIDTASQWTDTIAGRVRAVPVSAWGSPRDYGVDLYGYFGDDGAEPVNFRVQGSPDS